MLKLNNKGFAIASILYSIMVLFLMLLLSILGMLGSRKATLDKNKKDIINELNAAYSRNKIIFTHRDIIIPNSCNRENILNALMDGVSAIDKNGNVISNEYIRYDGIDVDNIENQEYNLTYTANNGGNTIVGTRHVYFGEQTDFDQNILNVSTIINCEPEPGPAIKVEIPEVSENETYIGIAYLDPADKTVECDKDIAAANVNSNGTPTEIDSGCMKWYIYKDLGDSYKAILDHNTTGYVNWYTSNSNVPLEDSNLQSLIDDLEDEWVNEDSFVTSVSTISAQEVSDIVGNIGNTGWTAGGAWYYLDSNNGTFSQSQVSNGNEGNQSKYYWLYDYTNDCIAYGCKAQDNNRYRNEANGMNDNTMGYWTATPYTGDNSQVWHVSRQGDLRAYYANNFDRNGFRPVITFPKSVVNTNG